MRKRKHDNKESFGSFFYYTEKSQRSPEPLSTDTSAQIPAVSPSVQTADD